MSLKAGDIIHAYCAFVPANKFVICICPINLYFFLINSDPRRKTPDAQIKIEKKDFSFLTRDSYIDTATLITIYPDEINKSTHKGALPTHLKEKILKVIDGFRHLSANQQAMIKSNLNPPKTK